MKTIIKPNRHAKRKQIKGLIEISMEEAHNLGANHLVVNSETAIVASEHERVAKELEKRNINVIRQPYGEVFKFGGSFRCCLYPLVREA